MLPRSKHFTPAQSRRRTNGRTISFHRTSSKLGHVHAASLRLLLDALPDAPPVPLLHVAHVDAPLLALGPPSCLLPRQHHHPESLGDAPTHRHTRTAQLAGGYSTVRPTERLRHGL